MLEQYKTLWEEKELEKQRQRVREAGFFTSNQSFEHLSQKHD